jgi:3-oxoacyl-[acyl-carrier protein] reductase
MDLSLRNKTALVCGSTQGIGLAIAQELSLLGATCILMARNSTALQAALSSLSTEAAQQHRMQVADFSEPVAVAKGVTDQLHYGPIHILINNTGGPAAGPITEAPTSAFSSAFSQHIINNQALAQALLPGMKAAGYGRIINIVSTSVKVPLPNLGVSNTIRAAVAGWAKTWATEVAQWGITVNNVLPGFTDTARLHSLISHNASSSGKEETEVRREMEASVPAQRFGEPAEVAALAAFLATPAAAYINGTNIPVDGGRTGAY